MWVGTTSNMKVNTNYFHPEVQEISGVSGGGVTSYICHSTDVRAE